MPTESDLTATKAGRLLFSCPAGHPCTACRPQVRLRTRRRLENSSALVTRRPYSQRRRLLQASMQIRATAMALCASTTPTPNMTTIR